MVEDRKQKPNDWNKKVSAQPKSINLPMPWKSGTFLFVFSCGFFSGIAFVLMFLK